MARRGDVLLNGTTVRLDPYQPAHTDGDTVVEFTDADVIHLGDLWWNGRYPFIDYNNGGGINGVSGPPRRISRGLRTRPSSSPAGPVGTRPDLAEYHDMLVTVRDNVAALKARGMSVEEVVAAKPTSRFDTKWGQFVFTPDLFTGLIYAGV